MPGAKPARAMRSRHLARSLGKHGPIVDVANPALLRASGMAQRADDRDGADLGLRAPTS